MDQRPSSAKTNLSSIGKRSTLNTESRAEKRVSYDETRLKKQLTLPENGAGYKTSSLPRGAKIGNSTDGTVTENTEQPRKTDGNGKSELVIVSSKPNFYIIIIVCVRRVGRGVAWVELVAVVAYIIHISKN